MYRSAVIVSAVVSMASVAVAAPKFTEFNIPTANSEPAGLTPGPDGNVWFTESDGRKIGRITPAGVITEYSLPVFTDVGGTTRSSEPSCIVAGPDGALWVNEGAANRFARITTSGTITTIANFNTTLSGQTAAQLRNPPNTGQFPDIAYPQCITNGPDGAFWIADQGPSYALANDGSNFFQDGWITRMTTAGALTRTAVTNPPKSAPSFITAGPDGALWFTMPTANAIGRITTAGAVTTFTVPTANSGPFLITAGPDGALWFTENTAGKIGRITTAGVITEFAIPTANSGPAFIVNGPQGALWFTEANGNKIARITTAGVVTEYALPTPNSSPFGLTVADGALWYAARGTNRVGKMVLDGTGTVIAPVYNSNTGNQSFIRMIAKGNGPVTFTLTVAGTPTGRTYGTTTYTVPQYASIQRSMADILSASNSDALNGGDTGYVLYLSAPANGELPAYQHVIFNGTSRFFENASVCAYTPAVTDYRFLNQALVNVHTANLAAIGYPSTVSIHNTGSDQNTFAVRAYDAGTGTLLGTVPVTVAAGATSTQPFSFFETALGFTASQTQAHVNLMVLQNAGVTNTATTPVGAVLTHNILNTALGATLNMTTYCAINP